MKCGSCQGTGLYVGFAEHNGYAVQCQSCKGTGKSGSKGGKRSKLRRDGIIWVIQTNPGMVVGTGHMADGTPLPLGIFGGMSYDDWLANKPFTVGMEMRGWTCPAWWYQNVDIDKKPSWDECIVVGSFSGCKNFDNKDKCWERWNSIWAPAPIEILAERFKALET